jgi:hypothetical protein
MAGCASTVRSARIDDGVSGQVGVSLARTVEPGDGGDDVEEFPLPQLALRYGKAPRGKSFGSSVGAIFPQLALEGYLQLPRWTAVDAGVGVHIAPISSAFVLVGGQVTPWLELFGGNRFAVGLGQENGRHFHADVTTAGIGIAAGGTVSFLLAVEYFYVPGRFTSGSGDWAVTLGEDFVTIGVTLDFHRDRRQPLSLPSTAR